MGGSAEAAIPALLQAWQHDIPEVRNDCVLALAAILDRERPELRSGVSLEMTRYQEFEANVISDAARRFPEVAGALPIDAEAKPAIAGSDDPARGSHPIRLETNRTSSAAGSRR